MITEKQTGARTRLELHEILDSISSESKRGEKIKLVQNYINTYSSFEDYIRCVFDEKISFLLPDSRPPFTPAEEGSVISSWHKQHINLTYFVKGLKADHVNVMRRESMYIGMLESVHPADAEILVDMIAKKTPCKGLTVKLVKEAIPNLL
tara:strand:+ start:2434 stop:2883 length:450 start_codon:yes stop_codon:yes gene_type:complete